MSFEIERKFLVCGESWRRLALSETRIRQAYLTGEGKASVRVRIKDDSTATLSIKSRRADLRRLELEYPIPVLEAEALIPLRRGAVVEKVRYVIAHDGLDWEVDVFSGENDGLLIAEVELKHERQEVSLPAWIGNEVTGRSEYYNGSLALRPYCSWRDRQVG